MAQTKTKASSKPKARSASKPKQRKSNRRPSRSKDSKPAIEAIESTAKEAGKTAKDAGNSVGRAVSKAKVPLVAGGAALAGVAGGAALGARQARRHRGVAGLTPEDFGKAARRVGDFGAQMGEVALELRRARENANGRTHRSPVEVVLDGLTARHGRD